MDPSCLERCEWGFRHLGVAARDSIVDEGKLVLSDGSFTVDINGFFYTPGVAPKPL